MHVEQHVAERLLRHREGDQRATLVAPAPRGSPRLGLGQQPVDVDGRRERVRGRVGAAGGDERDQVGDVGLAEDLRVGNGGHVIDASQRQGTRRWIWPRQGP